MNRWLTITLILIGASSASTVQAQQAPGAPEGTWTGTTWQRGDGIIIGKDDVKTELIVGKGTYEFPKGINRIGSKGTFKTVPGKNHIDFTPADGPAKGLTLKGIYEVKDDQLTLCFRPAGAERPTEFKSTDRTTVLAVYEKK